MIAVQTLRIAALAAFLLVSSSCESWDVPWRFKGTCRTRRGIIRGQAAIIGGGRPHLWCIPRGGYQHENDDADGDSDRYASDARRGDPDDSPPPPRRRPQQREPPAPPGASSSTTGAATALLGSIAKQSIKLTRKAVQLMAQQSTKAAYHVLRPKAVELEELLGLWRVDQELRRSGGSDDDNNVFMMELSLRPPPNVNPDRNSPAPRWRRLVLTITDGAGTSTVADDVRFQLSTSQLTHAQLRFTYRNLQYRAVVHRKLADPSVLKLKGTITYRPPEPAHRGLWQALGGGGGSNSRRSRDEKVGTFVARRRMKFDDETAEEEYDEEYDDEEAGEDDVDEGGGDESDVTRDEHEGGDDSEQD